MIRRSTIFFLFLIFLLQQIAVAEKIWQTQNLGISDTNVRSISVFPGDDRFICAASVNSVYFSQNSGKFWREIFSLEAEDNEINFIIFDSSDPKILYLATTKGLFATKNYGEHWRRIFRRVSESANNVVWIAFDSLDGRKIYIGTGEGLYISCDLGEAWQKAGGGLPHSEVRSIAVHPTNSQVLYLANTYGLFKSIDRGFSWERIYVTSHKVSDEENEDENEEDQENEEESSRINENQNLINCIAVDKRNSKKIFIATGEGVLVSHDAGESWNKLPAHGLNSDFVNFIVVSNKKGAVYAATKGGVFEFLSNLNRWQEIYQGMTARDARSLALNRKGELLWAGTDRGVFRITNLKNAPRQKKEEKVEKDEDDEIDFEQILKELSLNEPTIQQVQEAALRYAEVIHPKRIKSLRRSARLKALLPDVSLNYDKTIKDGGTTTNFGKFIVGPRDWGLSLSWDVGDLVFNSQLRLLNGSDARLMVQLRDDILNQVTRLYYERRRLQTQLILMPPETAEDRLTKTLRLEELTANIDALTGGYFSRHLER